MSDIASEDSELLTGSRGWDYPAWAPDFYPDDMPEDWWFSYYSNEFCAVLVPEIVLLAAAPETVTEWCDDAGDDFAFFIEVDTRTARDNWSAIKLRAQLLGEGLAGFVLCVSADNPDVDALGVMLQEMKQIASVCVRATRTDSFPPEIANLLEQYQAGSCWDAIAGRPEWDKSTTSVAVITRAQCGEMDAKQLREMIESVLQQMKGQHVRALIFEGDNVSSNVGNSPASDKNNREHEAPSISQLRQVNMICELLG